MIEPTTLTVEANSVPLPLPQPLWTIKPLLEKNGPLTDSPQPYIALPLQLLIATANFAHDSWVSSMRRTATAPRASLITESALAKLLPYCPAVAAPPVRPPVRPT